MRSCVGEAGTGQTGDYKEQENSILSGLTTHPPYLILFIENLYSEKGSRLHQAAGGVMGKALRAATSGPAEIVSHMCF